MKNFRKKEITLNIDDHILTIALPNELKTNTDHECVASDSGSDSDETLLKELYIEVEETNGCDKTLPKQFDGDQ